MATPTEVTTPTDHRPELVTVIAHMREKQGKEQDLRGALEALIPPSRQEEGYINYDLHQGIEDPSLFYLYENWETVDTHETHMHTPHLDDFAGRLDDLLDPSCHARSPVKRPACEMPF